MTTQFKPKFDEIGRGECPRCLVVKPRDRVTHLCHDCFSGEETSKEVGAAAAKLLADPEAPPEVKSVAASALTQVPDHAKHANARLEDHHKKHSKR